MLVWQPVLGPLQNSVLFWKGSGSDSEKKLKTKQFNKDKPDSETKTIWETKNAEILYTGDHFSNNGNIVWGWDDTQKKKVKVVGSVIKKL